MQVGYNNLGLLYKSFVRNEQKAEAAFKSAIVIASKNKNSRFFYPYLNLGQMYEKSSRTEEAQKMFEVAARMKQDDGLRFYSELLLPYVYQDHEDMSRWRKRFKEGVKRMEKEALVIKNPTLMEGVPQYYLSYHGKNDAKINARIARLFRRITPSVEFTAPHIHRYKVPSENRKIRVGFVSYYFRDHSVLKMTAGLFKHLDKDRFKVVLFQIGKIDDKTRMLEKFVSKLVPLGGLNFEAIKEKISDEELDVVVYAEIGMDPHSYALAMGRQAPVQIAMHGHASTTGIDSIDYYVTYKGFSEPNAQAHYSETLIELPGHTPLTLYYDLVKFPVSPDMHKREAVLAWRTRFKIPADAVAYACTQTLFKVSPSLDSVVEGILTGHEGSVVVLKELPMTDKVGRFVVERMAKVLSPELMSRVVFLPPLSEQDYCNMYAAVDVILDSFPFGGHTSSMDAFSVGRPVVTLPSKLMSGRCTQGFYEHMGIMDLVAKDVHDYVAIALKVGMDRAYRDKLSATIRERLPALISDLTSVRAWEQMLDIVVRRKEEIGGLLAAKVEKETGS